LSLFINICRRLIRSIVFPSQATVPGTREASASRLHLQGLAARQTISWIPSDILPCLHCLCSGPDCSVLDVYDAIRTGKERVSRVALRVSQEGVGHYRSRIKHWHLSIVRSSSHDVHHCLHLPGVRFRIDSPLVKVWYQPSRLQAVGESVVWAIGGGGMGRVDREGDAVVEAWRRSKLLSLESRITMPRPRIQSLLVSMRIAIAKYDIAPRPANWSSLKPSFKPLRLQAFATASRTRGYIVRGRECK
jgi:hypothetical protein